MHLKHPPLTSRARGFSLIEVLVALLVISIGLLGIAKMEALALSNTNGGRLRALAAIEAASLVATIQAERNYWGNMTTPLNVTITGAASGTTNVTSTDSVQNGAAITCAATTGTTIGPCTGNVSCISTATPCTAQKMAAYDLEQWAGRLQQVLGTDAVTINCSVTPVSCKIVINWAEETVNANASETTTMAPPSYTIFVNP